eukprot:TRINITY_DN3183_c0_g1_i9.p1 TRINITY_DN3183_c0_g1~~TRINITY_DN3183_c0_g1_i9.p1  ORF type:complete len:210 (+),score=35.39 TRINITY_DN3183_c0_g1_i9:581-1210(+)
MKGDEEGLGDPIEDCVSITAVSRITKLKEKILVSTGFGADRFNHVSDCSSLRAVAELTRIGGFLGSVSLEPDSPGFNFYCRCVKHLYEVFSFRSVLTGLIIASGKGYFGFSVPVDSVSVQPSSLDKSTGSVEVNLGLGTRSANSTSFVWPLMSILFAFDVEKVVSRSLISGWIGNCTDVQSCHSSLSSARKSITKRPVENIPPHEQLRL